jgi:hypothetical protein
VIADPLWREGRERRTFRGEGWEAQRVAVFGLAAGRAHGMEVDLARRAEIVLRLPTSCAPGTAVAG